LHRSRNQPPWDGLGVHHHRRGTFISQSWGTPLTIFPINLPPGFTPEPTVKMISQQHHYVKYAYGTTDLRNRRVLSHRVAPTLRPTWENPPGFYRGSTGPQTRFPTRYATCGTNHPIGSRFPTQNATVRPRSGHSRYLPVPPRAGLRGTNVHAFRLLGESPNRGHIRPPQHLGYHGALRHISAHHCMFSVHS
jgi:hypothetical protein